MSLEPSTSAAMPEPPPRRRWARRQVVVAVITWIVVTVAVGIRQGDIHSDGYEYSIGQRGWPVNYVYRVPMGREERLRPTATTIFHFAHALLSLAAWLALSLSAAVFCGKCVARRPQWTLSSLFKAIFATAYLLLIWRVDWVRWGLFRSYGNPFTSLFPYDLRDYIDRAVGTVLVFSIWASVYVLCDLLEMAYSWAGRRRAREL